MKIEVGKGSLVQALQRVQNVTDRKSNMPILSNTLIKTTTGEGIHLHATDLELSLRTQLDAAIQQDGNTTVSARKLLEIVRELPSEEISLELLSNDRLAIRSGRAHFELATLPFEDYPHLNFYEDVDLIPWNAEQLRDCLTKTFYAIPTEDDPFSAGGLFFHPMDSGDVRFVASDGHRLAWVQLSDPVFSEMNLGTGIIIPRKGVQEMLKILEKNPDLHLGLHEDRLLLRTPEVILSMKLLEQEFPEYQLIIPEERPFALQVDLEEFLHALKRMAILATKRWRHVRFTIREGTLEMEAGDPEVGTAREALDVQYEGEEEFTVAFNIRYLLDVVQTVGGSTFRFEWVDSYHGGIFFGPEDASYCSLIMPMVV